MTLPLTPTLPFTPATSVIPTSVLNAWRTFFPACLDADGGGTYVNTAPIIFDTGSAGWVFRGPLSASAVDPAGFRVSAVENGAAIVSASGSFILKADVSFTGTITSNAVVPLWTTPSRPFIITGALLQIRNDIVATADPGSVAFVVDINPGLGSKTLISGVADFLGGTTYAVDGTSSNKAFFGLDVSERGDLLTGNVLNNQEARTGAIGGSDMFAALTGPTNGFWGKSFALLVSPTILPSTFTAMDVRVIIHGYML